MMAWRARGSHRFEWLHLRSDGSPFYAEVTLTAMVMRGASLLHAVVRDISARKGAEQALFANRNLLQTLIESAGTVIYVLTPMAGSNCATRSLKPPVRPRARSCWACAARRFATGHCRRTRRQRPASDAQRRPA